MTKVSTGVVVPATKLNAPVLPTVTVLLNRSPTPLVSVATVMVPLISLTDIVLPVPGVKPVPLMYVDAVVAVPLCAPATRFVELKTIAGVTSIVSV